MAKKISKKESYIIAKKVGVDFNKVFRGQGCGSELTAIAKLVGYRKPKNASGSTGSCFFQYLNKIRIKNYW